MACLFLIYFCELDYTLSDNFGHPHILKGMDHPNEQIFLLGIGEKLDVTLAAVVADHSEACCTVCVSVVVQHICKAPVHLVGLARRCCVTASTVPLGSNLLPFGRDKVLVSGDVPFHCAAASSKTDFLQPFQACLLYTSDAADEL